MSDDMIDVIWFGIGWVGFWIGVVGMGGVDGGT